MLHQRLCNQHAFKSRIILVPKMIVTVKYTMKMSIRLSSLNGDDCRLFLENFMLGLKWISGAVVLYCMLFFVVLFLSMMKTFQTSSRK